MRRDSAAVNTFENAPLETEIETIDGQRFMVRLIVHPRARRVSVRVCPVRRQAIATAPSKRMLKHAAEFAAERAGWLARELARLPQGISLTPGARAPLRGRMCELVYEQGRAAPRFEDGEPPRLIAAAPDPELFESRLVRFFKVEARSDFTARVKEYAEVLQVKPTGIQVKELRSRWGSCSVGGVLAFSWRVVLAPSFVLDYLAAHEVAHLREMNHSRRFWTQVRRCLPDYERGRCWLHEHGAALHSVGMAR